jgi:hypothetical protein
MRVPAITGGVIVFNDIAHVERCREKLRDLCARWFDCHQLGPLLTDAPKATNGFPSRLFAYLGGGTDIQ